MNRKRILSLVLVGFLGISLYGCGKSDDDKLEEKTNKENKVTIDKKEESSKDQEKKGNKEEKEEKLEKEDNTEDINIEENKEEINSEINKDELKDSIVKGKDIIFKILTSRDQDKVDYENNRTGLTEEFNSIDKIKSALNPYYTDRYIEDFLKNILQAEEENGEITIALGDIGMWAEYSELNIKDIKDMGDNIYEVDYTAPSGVGDINHKATIEKVDNYWKMDKESNY